ncbi:nuclear transport factor 2 family protein [Aspergillus luchuensis]|uniref:Catabolic 3-dehydroquinase n=2 Tax=Aspergillus kawachii TaxID=1069201 RepID=A0A146FMK2_ASPKA|nr:uncharacterized protein AKAW2_21349S [Aspergillus luchuensis]OJZ91771.1 hypothetical protein ASPFODRAFT_213545 [Aspergillus luchuensis CBS 106.47]GAA82353.1 catabolic 3-dehydroquinase [Aspergillus luchuensis IFO 4308]BCR96409.1 hypothetical protein AKAW2_21349S [Aspergillus luchuensis]BCS08922.1 hypothetical protein ALUC_21292S [Aspergillus luchuensis]GAT26512.1 catabolic 3-dehydroquinase [Aspergillus luchuensis]
MVVNITAEDPQPTIHSHINGTTEEILDRLCVTELLKGWPVYRDASEWAHYRNCFAEQAYIFTTWSGGMPIDDFIEVSKKGRRNGDHIMHRENGTLVELNSKTGRAVGKMKATITQRFSFDGIEFDVECDCRFIMWCQKDPAGWKVHYKRLFYEKDKIMPVDGKHVPDFSEEELKPYPYGYRYLGASQARLGHKIKLDLPTMEDNDKFRGMYEAMEKWLRGEDIKETLGIPV